MLAKIRRRITADLRAAVAGVEGRIRRASWIQGGAIVAIPAGLKLQPRA